MESRLKQDRFNKLDPNDKLKLPLKLLPSRYKTISPKKTRSLSPKEKKSFNRSFDSKQWNKDIEKINKQEQAILKAIKQLNSKYNAAKARIHNSKKNLVKEDIQESKTKEIEKSLMQIDSKLKKLKKKHIPNDSLKKINK